MQGSTWSPTREFAKHVAGNSTLFAILALASAGMSAVVVFAERTIASKFVLYVLIYLEYAIVVVESGLMTLYLIMLVRDEIRRYLK